MRGVRAARHAVLSAVAIGWTLPLGAQTATLTSNRPGISESEALVGARVVQVEAGLSLTRARSQTLALSVPELTLRLGLAPRFELFASADGYLWSHENNRTDGSNRNGGSDVSFDAKNRVLVHGVPRFVLGVYDSGLNYNTTDAFWENLLWSPTGERRMNGMNINFYLNYWYGEAPASAMKAMMDNLAKHDVMYLQTGNCFDKFPAGQQFLINSSDAYVRDIGAHPNSGGYYTVDECISTLIPGAFAQYDRLRRLDPDSLTFMTNFARPDLMLWRDSADILSTDPYPLYHIEPSGGYDHSEVGDWTARTRDAVKDARPSRGVSPARPF